MVVEEMFELCCGMFGEKSSDCKVWRDGFLAMLNGVLAECFSIENGQRKQKGEMELKMPQTVQSFEDGLVYDEILLRKCVVWGVCTLLALSDDDAVKAGAFNNKYEYEKLYALRGMYVDVENCY